MTSAAVLMSFSTFLAAASPCVARLEPIRPYGDEDAAVADKTAAAVADIIVSLEQSAASLGKGVMVAASDWTSDDEAAGDVPRGFLRASQARHGQPVYAADAGRLLADGRRAEAGLRANDADDEGGDEAAGQDDDHHNHYDQTVAEPRMPAVCRPPPADAGLASTLPLRSRYVVLFPGPREPQAANMLAELSALDRSFWSPDVYYMLVVRKFDAAVRHIVLDMWRIRSVYKIIVVTPTRIKLLDPFYRNVVGKAGRFTNIPAGSVADIPDVLRSRTKNLQLFPLRISINIRSPTVVAGSDGAYVGQDGAIAAVLADSVNATPVYVSVFSNNAKVYYGYKQTGKGPYGTFSALMEGRADISINGHFLKDYGCYSAELTRHITSDKVCLLAPKAGVIPPMMTVLMSFQREVWTMTAITCIMVTVIYYAGTALHVQPPGQPTGLNLGLEIYRMFIGAPTNRLFAHSCPKLLTSFCLIFTLVILNAFQGSLVTFLSTPMHYPDINTFEDLTESDLPIRTSSISFKELLTGDPNLKSLANRVEKWAKEIDILNSDGHFAGFQRVNVFNLGLFKDVLYVANTNSTRVLHTMNECLISYFISNSPYKRRINILLSWIDQAGLVFKWNSDVSKHIFNKYKPINPKDYETSKVFSVRDLEIAFIVLSFGLILSITVFIVELLLRKNTKTHTPEPNHLPFLH